MKIATSLIESRKLQAIGINPSTADMHYAFSAMGGESFQDMIDASATLMVGKTNRKYPYEPAWSVGALIENIPASCDDGQHCFALINCNPKDDTEWLSCYEDYKGNLLNECYSDNPIDACYEMIVKLKEKGLM